MVNHLRRRSAPIAALLLSVCALGGSTSSIRAGEPPRRSLISQGDKEVAIYVLGRDTYYEKTPAEALRATPGTKIAFPIKLQRVAGDRLYVYGPRLSMAEFRLTRRAELPARKPGTNLLVGAVRRETAEGEPVTFEVRAAAQLQGDLRIFENRLARLSEEDGTAEAFLRLADWLAQAEDQSQVVDQEEMDRYARRRRVALEEGVSLFEKRLPDPVPDQGAAFLAFCTETVDSVERNPAGNALARYGAACRRVLESVPASRRALERDAELGVPQARRVAAAGRLAAARLHTALLDEKKQAEAFIRQAAALAPSFGPVEEIMNERGLVLYESEWMSPRERIRRQRGAAEREAARAAAAAAQQEAARRKEVREKVSDTAVRGAEFVETRYDIAMLVAAGQGAGLKELIELLPEMPVYLARRALFEAASRWGGGHPAGREFLSSALESKRPIIRIDAAEALVATAPEAAGDLVSRRIAKETDQRMIGELVDVLWNMEGRNGIAAVVGLTEKDEIPEAARGRAVTYLKEETGVVTLAWGNWWDENQDTYQRTPLPGEVR